MEPSGVEYDASQIELRHIGMPEHDWHPAALFRILVGACSASPFLQSPRFNSRLKRQVAVGLAAARLGERGVDVDELVRCVFRGMYVGEFIRVSLRAAYDFSWSEADVPAAVRPLGAQALDRVGAPLKNDSFSAYLRRAANEPDLLVLGRRVAGWISRAELRDLLRWQLPMDADFEQYPELEVGPKVCDSRWLADRFLLTYLDGWNTASLHAEFSWSSGSKGVALTSDMMELRRVPQERLNAEIAKRAVEGEGRVPRALLAVGVQLLKDGDHEQAAALFQGALAVSDSQWVRNCLAFCLVPSDPAGADLMFTELLEEGFDPPIVLANLAATNRILNDLESAHGNARRGLTLLSETDLRSASLWGFEDGMPVLMPDIKVVDYLRFVLGWGPA